MFPAGVLAPRRPVRSVPGGDGLSFHVRLLPFMEQKPLYDLLNLSLPVDAQPQREAQIGSYLCPADPRNYREPRPAPTNYAGCQHHVEAPIDVDNHGSFLLGRGLAAVDFTDGLSYTLLIAEKDIPDDDRGWMSGLTATLRNTGTPFRRFTLTSAETCSPS